MNLHIHLQSVFKGKYKQPKQRRTVKFNTTGLWGFLWWGL